VPREKRSLENKYQGRLGGWSVFVVLLKGKSTFEGF